MEHFIQKISQISVSLEQIDNLKQKFEKQIDSPRLSSRIQTIDRFLYALQQRDVLSGKDIAPIQRICSELRHETIMDELQSCKYLKANRIYDNQNSYASQRIQELAQENASKANQHCREEVDSTKRNIIYKLIASDIGRKWREFGRNLGIKEGNMDDLDSQFPKDFKSKVYGLFKILEDDIDGHQKYAAIYRALDDCRRTDLKRKLDEILHA